MEIIALADCFINISALKYQLDTLPNSGAICC